MEMLNFLDAAAALLATLVDSTGSMLTAAGITAGTLVVCAFAYNFYTQRKANQAHTVRTVQLIIFENLQNVRELVTVRKTIKPVMTIAEKKTILGLGVPFTGRNLTIS